MNQHQRQLVLLVTFMTLLAAVFIFLIQYAPEALELDIAPKKTNATSSNMTLPEPLNSSIHGLKQLYGDAVSGLSNFN